jgi:hypothetical protein
VKVFVTPILWSGPTKRKKPTSQDDPVTVGLVCAEPYRRHFLIGKNPFARFSSYSARSISPRARRRLRISSAVGLRPVPDVQSATQTIIAAKPTRTISGMIRWKLLLLTGCRRDEIGGLMWIRVMAEALPTD